MKYRVIYAAIFTVCFSAGFAWAQNKVVVVPLGNHGLKAVSDSSPCDAANAGKVRWTGSNFEGCNGTAWIVFSMPFGTVTSAGQVWMDRNLGASRVATSSSDSAAYGDLYQWGRLTDGHEQRTSPTTTTPSANNVPGHGNFILPPSSPYDWLSSPNNNLWQGISGINNPCPAGFRLPTDAEWQTEISSWNSNNIAGAFGSPLKLVTAGYRSYGTGAILGSGSYGFYWSSTVNGSISRNLNFHSSAAGMVSNARASGYSVRCIQD